ncbi:MAG: hypothetical protein JST89_06380 [Cyanobacteria bacterium SZAS-4]|nr:hypothetical protein [Cyanobacteria bacterium SZAS-4]
MAANDKPVVQFDDHESNLSKQASNDASAHLSDQASKLQIADAQKRVGDRAGTAVTFETASADGAIALSPEKLVATHGQAFGNLPDHYQKAVYSTVDHYVEKAQKENNPQLAAAMSQYSTQLRQFTA